MRYGISVIRSESMRITRVFVTNQCGYRGVSLRFPAVNGRPMFKQTAQSDARTARPRPQPHAEPDCLVNTVFRVPM